MPNNWPFRNNILKKEKAQEEKKKSFPEKSANKMWTVRLQWHSQVLVISPLFFCFSPLLIQHWGTKNSSFSALTRFSWNYRVMEATKDIKEVVCNLPSHYHLPRGKKQLHFKFLEIPRDKGEMSTVMSFCFPHTILLMPRGIITLHLHLSFLRYSKKSPPDL